MYEFYPYFTNDGSVGLFSPKDNDIYHSTHGALTEAYEKFIYPMNLNNYFKNNNSIKILDICYGIGYNSKALINYIIEKKYSSLSDNKNSIAPIHTNNSARENNAHKPSNLNIYIKAIDTDKNLGYLSPFFVTGKNKVNNKKLSFTDSRVEKLLNGKKESEHTVQNNIFIDLSNFLKHSIKNTSMDKNNKNNPKLLTATNILILNQLIDRNNNYLIDVELNNLLSNKKYKQYFDKYLINLFKHMRNGRYKYTPIRRLSTFLHNIYYNHLSNSYKTALRFSELNEFNFNLIIKDARQELIDDTEIYNFIFLDAFTPAKCPCLWSVDFFKLLYTHLDNDGMIFTYSNSASVRNALLEAGFYIGKIYNPSAEKFMGTVAAKNKDLIKNKLTDYDLGLLKTKAGIVYRDKDLTGLNESIIATHNIEVQNSKLISSSKYIKQSRSTKNV